MKKTNRIMKGTYSDYKLIKSRNVVQIGIEIPIEQAEEFVSMFGMPKPDTEKWVAIAGLNEEIINKNDTIVRAIQQAGMICKDKNFADFLIKEKKMIGIIPEDDESIAKALRALLGIKSRTDFHKDHNALLAFNRLQSEYEAWTIDS